MNFTFCIFGTPNSKFDQYQRIHSDLFKMFAENPKSSVQYIIYRKNQLVYYTYIRHDLISNKQDGNEYFGISMILNQIIFSDNLRVLYFFEKLFDCIVSEGELLKRNEDDQIEYVVKNFSKKRFIIEKYNILFRKNIKSLDQIQIDNLLNRNIDQTIKYLPKSIGNPAILNYIRVFKYIIISPSEELAPIAVKPVNKRILLALGLGVVVLIILGIVGYKSTQRPVIAEVVEMNLPDGNVYIYSGELTNGLPNGYGKAIYNDGSIYEGNFSNGLRHGKGKMTYPDGHTYTGVYEKNAAIQKVAIQFPLDGTYSCNISSPPKNSCKIIITHDSTSDKYYGEFINYSFSEPLTNSEFTINNEGNVISNEILGEGNIIHNSKGEIEILSKPKNTVKWNMRKLQ